jgi:hypothetical protein
MLAPGLPVRRAWLSNTDELFRVEASAPSAAPGFPGEERGSEAMTRTAAEWEVLQGATDGRVVLPDSPDYGLARRPEMVRFQKVLPEAVVLCRSAADVSATIAGRDLTAGDGLECTVTTAMDRVDGFVLPRQDDDQVLAVTCRPERSTDRDAVGGSRSSQLDAQTALDPTIQVRLVDSLDHLDGLHGCVPFSVLSAVDGRMADVVRVDAPMLSVGLDATGKPGPALPASAVLRHGPDELDKVVRLSGDGVGGERGAPVGHLGGELVAVGQGVGMLLEPGGASRCHRFQFAVAFIDTLEQSAVVSAGPGQHAGPGVLLETLAARRESR